MEEYSIGYHEQNKTSGKDITNEILAYTGKESHPRWVNEQSGESFCDSHSAGLAVDTRLTGDFKRLCLVRGDVSKVAVSMQPALIGQLCMKKFSIILRFGTELTAQIGWEEDVRVLIHMR